MSDPATHDIHAGRFGWFSAGVVSAVALLAAFFFLGDYMFGAAHVEAGTSDQIIVGQ